ncbi:hypothetical protein TNCT6_54660 [Streptomyces sp. 6-11-2]|nr:hypothetical protein TNCT6_54660 [Streptomyces sp. 6-11-2]
MTAADLGTRCSRSRRGGRLPAVSGLRGAAESLISCPSGSAVRETRAQVRIQINAAARGTDHPPRVTRGTPPRGTLAYGSPHTVPSAVRQRPATDPREEEP